MVKNSLVISNIMVSLTFTMEKYCFHHRSSRARRASEQGVTRLEVKLFILQPKSIFFACDYIVTNLAISRRAVGQMLKAAPRTEIFILMNAWAAGRPFANFGVTFV